MITSQSLNSCIHGVLVRRASKLLVLLAIVGLAACSTSTNMKKTGDSVDASKIFAEGDKKILIMPLDVELSLLTASGLTEPKAEWTEAAIEFMNTSLKESFSEIKNETQFYEREKLDPASDIVQLEKLHEATGVSILFHDLGALKLPARKDRSGEWSLGEKVKVLKEQTGADYALFVFVRDSYSSGGRAALMVLAAVGGVGVTGGQQVGYASLVDLETGDIEWFNRLLSTTGDLRKQSSADNVIKQLLKGLI